MPTLTFYLDTQHSKRLAKVLAHRKKQLNYKVSRGMLFAPYIDQLFEQVVKEGQINPETLPIKKTSEINA